MSGSNFNLTTQQPSTSDPLIINIYSAAQLPLQLAPDGVMRWKPSLGKKYIFHSGITLPRVWLPTSVDPATLEVIEFTANFQGSILFIAGDTTPHIWGRNVNSLILRDINIFDSTPQTTKLLDLVGVGAFSTIAFLASPIFGFLEGGNLVNINYTLNNSSLVDLERGVTLRNDVANSLHILNSSRIANLSAITTESPSICFLGTQGTVAANTGNVSIGASDSLFCIDSAATGTYDITGNSFDGIGDFFMSPISNSITAFANVDVAVTSFSDSSVNPGVDTSVNFASPTDAVVGQSILLADEAAYDGTHVIIRVADDQLSFDINVAFSTSGVATLKRTQVTSISHKLTRDQTNTISGTTNYNGTTKVLQIVDNDNFVIPTAFVADDATGIVASNSNDEETPGITSVLNGEAKNSQTIGIGEMNANVNTTSIAASTYAAIDVTGTVENVITERFSLTTPSSGIFTYIGAKDIVATLFAVITATKIGSTVNYRFAVSINGAVPVFASASYAPMEVKTTKVAATILKPISLSNGDTVQIMAAGDGTSDDLTITDFVIELKGD
jgi:hypothetical protein